MVVALAVDEGILAAKVEKGLFITDTLLEYLQDDMVCPN